MSIYVKCSIILKVLKILKKSQKDLIKGEKSDKRLKLNLIDKKV